MSKSSIIEHLTDKSGYKNYFSSIFGSGFAHSIADIASSYEGILLVLLSDAANITPLKKEIVFFLGDNSDIPVITLPDWETLPYDYFSPHQAIISERLETLYQLQQLKRAIVISPVSSALQKLPARQYIQQNCLLLKRGQRIGYESLSLKLQASGYNRVTKVMEYGEFAVRGSIIDLYPMGSDSPIRLELFDDEIESIRYFDPETQLTFEKVEEINLLPAREYPTDDEAITRFRQNWRSTFDSNLKEASIYRDVSNGIFPAGIEYYLPLFFEQLSTLFDFIDSEKRLVIHQNDLSTPVDSFWQELKERYEQYRYDVERPILTPESLFLQPDELFSGLKQFTHIVLQNKSIENQANEDSNKSSIELNYKTCPDVQIEHRASEPLTLLCKQLPDYNKVLFCAESPGREEVLRELLIKHNVSPNHTENWQSFNLSSESIYLTTAPVREGFVLNNTLVVSESNLFGHQILQSKRHKEKSTSADQVIHSLAELKVGDPVVHVEHGVGRYQGLQTIATGDLTNEFLTLEYAGEDKLYVPIQSLYLIHRYSGSNPETAPWHKLGSETWSKAKTKALQKARDTAAELLDIYARRAAEQGVSHKLDQIDYDKFSAEFEFEATPDQHNAIESVVKDMRSEQPMDRLICGDVGFGKTEVAMRATFIAIQSSMQVAVLVPTTLLAQQHFNSFQDRFSNWPANIAVLSRFQTKKEQEALLKKLESGQVDIVIGTHRLLTGKPKFKNLGLLIIDEEHRFGVRQKEILKSFRSKVDILTLTATPIPRTLNMSMSGMRDLSIIATPPARRLAIKTFVRQYNMPLIKEAIQREVRRGGQVYFLHNAVESIERVAKELREELPHLSIAVAHGQMRERELESVMTQFYHHQFHILICTTIIETGIDVPTANTIIMNRADKLGLAQLHQLRGRVGRSHHQAYAYLLTPDQRNITKDAKKRLEAIGNLEDLGSGFILATHDLEIRGAGELLGDEQSGHMQTIGFSLYMELLDKAVNALKSGQELSLQPDQEGQTEINLGESSLLPDDYIADVAIRLSLYKRIANAANQEQLKQLQIELIDRFGLLPEPAKTLFSATELKLHLTQFGITKLEADSQSIRLEFSSEPQINANKLIELIQTQPEKYRLNKGTQLKITSPNKDIEERKMQIESLIGILTN